MSPGLKPIFSPSSDARTKVRAYLRSRNNSSTDSSARCLGLVGDRINFHQGVLGQARHLDGRAGGRDDTLRREVSSVHLVHGGEVGHIFEEDGGLDDVGQVEASLFKDRKSTR